MYDDPDPRGSRRGHPVLAAFLTSLITTTAVFAALTVAEERGLLAFLHLHGQGDVEVPSITVVSSGASTNTVPNLAGYRPDDAVEQLRTRKLVPGRRQEEASDTVAAGLVIGTEPPFGATVATNATVALVVSTGPAARAVPKLLGLPLGKAKKLIGEAGFKLGTTKSGSSDRYDDEAIIKQEPVGASLAPAGSEINVVVND